MFYWVSRCQTRIFILWNTKSQWRRSFCVQCCTLFKPSACIHTQMHTGHMSMQFACTITIDIHTHSHTRIVWGGSFVCSWTNHSQQKSCFFFVFISIDLKNARNNEKTRPTHFIQANFLRIRITNFVKIILSSTKFVFVYNCSLNSSDGPYIFLSSFYFCMPLKMWLKSTHTMIVHTKNN